MEGEVNEFHREDYYFAQIALEVRRSWISKDAKPPEIKDFILNFQAEDNSCKSNEETRKERLKKSKSFWRALLGG